MQLKSQEGKLRGVVSPEEWDEEDNVIGISIWSDDEEEYTVDPEGKGLELFDCIDEEVEVEGTLTQHEDGRRSIHVKRFKVTYGDDL